MIKRRQTKTISVICGAMLFTSSAWSATVEPGQGSLLVNQGQGFQPVNSRIDANVGDSVMVGPGGSASVVYGDGCSVDVQPGAVTTIAPLSPCASGSYAQETAPSWCTGTWLATGGCLVFIGGVATIIWAATQLPPPPPVTP